MDQLTTSEKVHPFYVEQPGQKILVPTETPNLDAIYTTKVEDVGRIADPAVAEDIAYVEKPGRDAALDREAELKRQHEGGLTDTEKKYLVIMDGLNEKNGEIINTHAFEDRVDGKGRKARALHLLERYTPGVDEEKDAIRGEIVFFNKDGIFALDVDSLVVKRDMLGKKDRIPELIGTCWVI